MVVILSHNQNIIISKIDCSELWGIEYYRILYPQSYFQMSNSCCVTWLDDDKLFEEEITRLSGHFFETLYSIWAKNVFDL